MKRLVSMTNLTVLKSWLTMESMLSYNKSDLRDIKTPILVIVAGEDDRIKPEHTIQISTLIENSKLEVVKGAPHFGIVKRKKYIDIVIGHIFNFL